MEVSHNHNAKSQLAKLLATENITVQHSASAKTAWFDVKSRVLMLPVWREMSNDLYDLLVVHEVGHAYCWFYFQSCYSGSQGLSERD
jgi:hypothetical protein